MDVCYGLVRPLSNNSRGKDEFRKQETKPIDVTINSVAEKLKKLELNIKSMKYVDRAVNTEDPQQRTDSLKAEV